MSKQIQVYKESPVSDIKSVAWKGLSDESQKAYQSDYNLFLSFVKKDFTQVQPGDILDYIKKLKVDGYKNSSINRKVAALSKLFKVLLVAGEIKANPVEQLKNVKRITMKVDKGINVPLTIEDVRAITGGTVREKKMSLIVKTLASTGLRISEFINIKNSDILDYNEDCKKVRIIGKGEKERFIFLQRILLNEIRAEFPSQNEIQNLFYTNRFTPYNRKTLWKQIHDIFMEKTGKNVHPHFLRHWFATRKLLVEKRDIKSISRYLGHADVSTTITSYIDTALSAEESAINI
jgi:integrase/recombinase XerD